MSSGVRVDLYPGASVLVSEGVRTVVRVHALGVDLESTSGEVSNLWWSELQSVRGVADGRVDAIAVPLATTLAGLSKENRERTLDKLEVVLTILTGYANGHPALARRGEPLTPFDPKNGWSQSKRCEAMADLLDEAARHDRRAHRARETGRRNYSATLGAVRARTLHNWIGDFSDPVNGGVLALIDGRSRRSYRDFDSLDPEVIRVADEVVSRQDGSQAALEINELYRRTRLQLNSEGLHHLPLPEKTLRAYLTHSMRRRGKTTRSHTTTRLRGAMSVASYPAIRPGQVVAVDVTRADNFVIDPATGQVISVEIITALDVCSRVVLALRVVPRSATSLEAALLLYDVLRPFSQAVSAEEAHDWRWAGVPEFFGPVDEALVKAEELSGRPLIGEHQIPGLLPDAIRADHGSIFTSQEFRDVCDRLDIHLLLSRGKKPTDNAFVERWHETLQRPLQQLSGHKGRNVSQRGSQAGKIEYDAHGRAVFRGSGGALTPRQLEIRLREFIATDYHRTPHGGLTVHGRSVDETDARVAVTPLEAFDMLLGACGRLHVLQRADLIYDLLPIRWGTISHAGVEFLDLTYDCRELDEFRNVTKGFFRDGDRAAPFFWDSRDMSRVWFRHPHTQEIVEVPWRRAFQLRAPLTEVVYRRARSLVKKRYDGRLPATPKAIQDEILDTVNDIADIKRLRADPDLEDWVMPSLSTAHMRHGRSVYEHAEAAAAMHRPPTPSAAISPNATTSTHTRPARVWKPLDTSRRPR